MEEGEPSPLPRLTGVPQFRSERDLAECGHAVASLAGALRMGRGVLRNQRVRRDVAERDSPLQGLHVFVHGLARRRFEIPAEHVAKIGDQCAYATSFDEDLRAHAPIFGGYAGACGGPCKAGAMWGALVHVHTLH